MALRTFTFEGADWDAPDADDCRYWESVTEAIRYKAYLVGAKPMYPPLSENKNIAKSYSLLTWIFTNLKAIVSSYYNMDTLSYIASDCHYSGAVSTPDENGYHRLIASTTCFRMQADKFSWDSICKLVGIGAEQLRLPGRSCSHTANLADFLIAMKLIVEKLVVFNISATISAGISWGEGTSEHHWGAGSASSGTWGHCSLLGIMCDPSPPGVSCDPVGSAGGTIPYIENVQIMYDSGCYCTGVILENGLHGDWLIITGDKISTKATSQFFLASSAHIGGDIRYYSSEDYSCSGAYTETIASYLEGEKGSSILSEGNVTVTSSTFKKVAPVKCKTLLNGNTESTIGAEMQFKLGDLTSPDPGFGADIFGEWGECFEFIGNSKIRPHSLETVGWYDEGTLWVQLDPDCFPETGRATIFIEED